MLKEIIQQIPNKSPSLRTRLKKLYRIEAEVKKLPEAAQVTMQQLFNQAIAQHWSDRIFYRIGKLFIFNRLFT
jgi:hypothetical protein